MNVVPYEQFVKLPGLSDMLARVIVEARERVTLFGGMITRMCGLD